MRHYKIIRYTVLPFGSVCPRQERCQNPEHHPCDTTISLILTTRKRRFRSATCRSSLLFIFLRHDFLELFHPSRPNFISIHDEHPLLFALPNELDEREYGICLDNLTYCLHDKRPWSLWENLFHQSFS